jgi:hypothetical protein
MRANERTGERRCRCSGSRIAVLPVENSAVRPRRFLNKAVIRGKLKGAGFDLMEEEKLDSS